MITGKRPIFVGTDDWYDLVKNSQFFVDKTELISEIITGDKASLFPRPRRWGKSLNMSMLYYFFNLALDEEGNILSENPYKKLFKNLKIAKINITKFVPEDEKDESKKVKQEINILETYQGQYPVILVSFKSIGGDNFGSIEDKLIEVIRELYSKHIYLLNSTKLDDIEKEIFNLYRSGIMDAREKGSIKVTIGNSINFLSSILEKHFKRKVYVLVDEYDKPINDVFGKKGYEDVLFQETSGLISDILSAAIKGNLHLEKGVLTGILRAAKGNTFSGLNNVTEFNITDSEYIEYFGFLEEEVIELLNKIEGIDKAEELERVRDWYNGYSLPPGSKEPRTMYNPWSIANYINSIITEGEEARPKNYWKDSGNNLIIKYLLKKSQVITRNKLRKIIEGKEEIEVEIKDSVSYDEISGSDSTIWSLLLHTGYLSVRDYKERKGFAKIPNKEVVEAYMDQIKYWFEGDRDKKLEEEYHGFLSSLIAGNVELFKDALASFVKKSFSYFDTGGKNSERVYHGFILGMLVDLRDEYELISNQEAGHGRFDLCLRPIKKENGKIFPDYNRLAILIEFKSVASTENLIKKAKEGLKQIKDKEYLAAIEGFDRKLLMGIAFQGKKTHVESEFLK